MQSLSSVSNALHLLRPVLLWVFLPLAAFFAFPSLLIALLVWWRISKTWDSHERWSGTWLLAVICTGAYAGLLWFGHSFPSLVQAVAFGVFHHAVSQVVLSLERLWGLDLLLTPLYALILEGLHPLSRRVHLNPRRPVPPSSKILGSEESQSLRALTTANQTSPIPSIVQSSTHELHCQPLGEFLGGELYEWVYGNELCLPLEEFKRHMVVLGEPGYGKTMTLLRMASIAVGYGMQVIYIDLKGSMKTAAQFVAVMHLLGVRRIKSYPHEPYDGWCGDARTLYNRLMQMVDPGTHPFYHKLTSSLVSLAVYAPGGPPKNSKEFLQRLDQNWLYRAYAGKTMEQASARRKIGKLVPHLADLSLTFEGFFDGIAGALDGQWAFEDGDAVYIGLDGDAQKEQAALMGRYLLEECAHYAKHRKGSRHALLILDEFGVLESANATDLYERIREPGMSVCASAQSYEGLGPERKHVVAASSLKIVHRCGDPEEIVKYAGQREMPTFSHFLEEDEEATVEFIGNEQPPKRRLGVRMQRQYALPIEEVQQLGIGTIGLSTGGLYALCQVHLVAIPDSLLRAALAYVSTSPAATPTPSEPSPPKKTARHSSSSSARESAQKQDRGKGRGMKEAQVPQSLKVSPDPSFTPEAATVQPPSQATLSTPLISSERGCGDDQMAPDTAFTTKDDEGPVDF
jgi:hypothetical protein